jgi:predicted ABC-type ATPase
VNLVYLWLPGVELAVERVAQRLKAGGHHVPEPDIRRRYDWGRINFVELYAPLADTWEVYDNSGFEPFLIAFGGRDEPTTILETEQWQRIKGQAL